MPVAARPRIASRPWPRPAATATTRGTRRSSSTEIAIARAASAGADEAAVRGERVDEEVADRADAWRAGPRPRRAARPDRTSDERRPDRATPPNAPIPTMARVRRSNSAIVGATSGWRSSASRTSARSTNAGAKNGWWPRPQPLGEHARRARRGPCARSRPTALPASWTTAMDGSRRAGIARTTRGQGEPHAIPITSPRTEQTVDARGGARGRRRVSGDPPATTHRSRS